MVHVPKLDLQPRPDLDAGPHKAQSKKPVVLPPAPGDNGTRDAQQEGYESRSTAVFGTREDVFGSNEACHRPRWPESAQSSKTYSMPQPPALERGTNPSPKRFVQTGVGRPDVPPYSQLAEQVGDGGCNRGGITKPRAPPFHTRSVYSHGLHPTEPDRKSPPLESRRMLPTPPPRQGFFPDTGDAVTHHVEALLAKQAHAMSEKLRADIHDARLRAEVKKVRIQQELQQALHSVAAARSSPLRRAHSEPPVTSDMWQACLLSSPFTSAAQSGLSSICRSPPMRQTESRVPSVERFPPSNPRVAPNCRVASSANLGRNRPAESFHAGRLLLPPPPLVDLPFAEPVPKPRSPASTDSRGSPKVPFARPQPLSWQEVRAAALARRAASTDARPWAGRSPPVPGVCSFSRPAGLRLRSPPPPDLVCREDLRNLHLPDSTHAFESAGRGPCPRAMPGVPQSRTDLAIGRGVAAANQLRLNAAKLVRERAQAADIVHRRLDNLEVERDGLSRDDEQLTTEDQELLRLVGKLRVMVAAKKDDFIRGRLPPPPQCLVGPQRPVVGAAQRAQDSTPHFLGEQKSAFFHEEKMHPKESEGYVRVEPSPKFSSGEPEAEKSLDESPPPAAAGMQHTVASRCLRANGMGALSTSTTSGSSTGSFTQTWTLSRSGSFSNPPPECLRRIALPSPPSPEAQLEAQGPRTPEFRAPREARPDGVPDVFGASRNEPDKAPVTRSTGRLPMVPLLLLGRARSSAETSGSGHER